MLVCTLACSALPAAQAQGAPSWGELAPDRLALAQQTALLSMRLYLESELELDGMDVTWRQSPRAMRKALDGVVNQVMALQGERGLDGFGGFSEAVEWLLEDVEELDERDALRGSGRIDRSVEERFYVLLEGRLNEVELQLALELGVFERSGLWDRIVSASGWEFPADPGAGAVLEALEVPVSRRTREVLGARDESAFPASAAAQVPDWVGQLAALLGGAPPPTPGPNGLEALNLPESFDVPFAPGSAVLDLNARMQLAEVRDLMTRHPELRVVCTGHADSNGPRKANEALSRVRAEAVQAKLLESGVSQDRVLMNYFGEDRAGWDPEDDRRVEVRFIWDGP